MNQEDRTEFAFIEQMIGKFFKLQRDYVRSQLLVRIDRLLSSELSCSMYNFAAILASYILYPARVVTAASKTSKFAIRWSECNRVFVFI